MKEKLEYLKHVHDFLHMDGRILNKTDQVFLLELSKIVLTPDKTELVALVEGLKGSCDSDMANYFYQEIQKLRAK